MLRLLVAFGVLAGLLTASVIPQRVSCDSLPQLTPTTALVLAGHWRIDFVADTGPRSGRHLQADLILFPTTPAQRVGRSMITGASTEDSTYIFYGTMSTDLRRLGALRSGDVRSPVPDKPGIRVHARHQVSGSPPFLYLEIKLLPALPQDWTLVLDGDYTTLEVLALGPTGFRGTWESGGGENAIAGRGRFCASFRP